jgi:hypothetical protein
MIRRRSVVLATSLMAPLLGLGIVASAKIGVGNTALSALAQDAANIQAPSADAVATAAVVTYRIPTITCSVDPLRVEGSLQQAPGILEVAFDGQITTVTYDPAQMTPEANVAAIEAGGDVVEPAAA